jgi:hypothetical protein
MGVGSRGSVQAEITPSMYASIARFLRETAVFVTVADKQYFIIHLLFTDAVIPP